MNALGETVLDTAPRSFVLLGVAAAAIILSVVAGVLRHWRGTWAGLPRQLAVAAGSLLLLVFGLVLAAAQVWRSTVIHQLLQGAGPAGEPGQAEVVSLGIRVQFAALVFVGGLMLVVLTLVTLGLTLSWRDEIMRGHRALALARLRAVALLLPAWPVAAGALLYGLRTQRGFMAVAGVDPSMKTVELLHTVEGAYPLIRAARLGLLLLVALSAVTAVAMSRREAVHPTSSLRSAAAVWVFLAGLVAFALTRGHAADWHPLQVVPNAADASYATRVPALSHCPATEPAPALEFATDFVRLDWIHVDPNEFQANFERARNNYALLHAGRPFPFLIIVADPATPTDRIIPYLQKVSDGTSILLASATSHPVLSRTLGTIPRYEICGRTFRLVYRKTATPLSRWRSWSEVAAAIDGSSERIEVAPW